MKSAIREGINHASLVMAGVIYAVALRYFVLPSRVILTGTEGIAASVSYYVESDALFLGLYLIFHLTLIGFAWFKIGRGFAWRTLVVVAVVALVLWALPPMTFASPAPQDERLILVIFGGILAGAAKAIAFQAQGSAGDEDVIAAYFASKYLRPVGSIAVLAAVVSTAVGLELTYLKSGAFEPVVNTLMYTSVYIFVSAEVLNTLYRKFRLTMLTALTAHPERIGDTLRGLYPHRTYTTQDSVGGRSGKSYKMLRTIVTHEELPALLEAIEITDPGGFYFYHDIEGASRRYYITPIGAPRTPHAPSPPRAPERPSDEVLDEQP